MPTPKIRFISSNPSKITEVQQILGAVGIEICPLALKIEEIQSDNPKHLIEDKALKAFQQIGRPLIVEHTGLHLSYMNDLPGGLTQIFWDRLQADRFAELFGKTSDNRVIAKTHVGYVDGKKIHIFDGEIAGHVAAPPRGDTNFQWDCIFVPEGHDQTFAEMGAKKNDISMRRQALDKLAAFLKEEGGA
jgi:XTP/dITP diphosphohydrolase